MKSFVPNRRYSQEQSSYKITVKREDSYVLTESGKTQQYCVIVFDPLNISFLYIKKYQDLQNSVSTSPGVNHSQKNDIIDTIFRLPVLSHTHSPLPST